MFRREENFDKVETLLGRGTEFRGNLVSRGVVRLDGKFEGEIQHGGSLFIGESAQVTANVKCKHLTVAGQLRGNVDCEGKLELLPSGHLYGDIKMAQLVIADGAVFQGASMMREPADPKKKAEFDPKTA